jgi:hypothetical protein
MWREREGGGSERRGKTAERLKRGRRRGVGANVTHTQKGALLFVPRSLFVPSLSFVYITSLNSTFLSFLLASSFHRDSPSEDPFSIFNPQEPLSSFRSTST